MNDDSNCRKYRELLPLYHNGKLEPDLADGLKDHLDHCPDCRDVYRKERALFELAGAELPSGSIDSHPDSDMLDQYVSHPESLAADQRAEMEKHLSECPLCRETCEKLSKLPAALIDLTSIDQLPITTSLDQESQTSEGTAKVTDITRRIWRPLTVLATAAVVVLIAVTMLHRQPSAPVAAVEGLFPVTVREQQKPILFETTAEEFVFKGRLLVDPEADHTYGLQVRTADSDSLLYREDRIVNFDDLGYTWFETAMTPGSYRLTLYDIIGTDSLEVVWPFELRLVP